MGKILTAARAAAQDRMLTIEDVGKLVSQTLEDGKIDRGERRDLEKIKTELKAELSPAARAAIDRFLGLGDTFEPNLAGRIFGVDMDAANALEMAGARSPQDLLIAAKTPAMRETLSSEAGLNLAMVTDWAERADLARIVGVSTKYAAVLEKVGVPNVQTMSKQDARALKTKIDDFLATDDGKAITKRRPGLRTVQKWARNARELPQLLFESTRLTMDHFSGLNNESKTAILLGNWRDGQDFHDDLSISVPRRKPAVITAFIERLERDCELSGDDTWGRFDSVELESVELLKLGDDKLGYRATFSASREFTEYYEGIEPGETENVTHKVAFDPSGEVLGSETDWD